MISRSRQAVLASLVGFAFTGCRSNNVPLQQAPIVDGSLSASDPASANLPPASIPEQYDISQQYAPPQPYAGAQQGYGRRPVYLQSQTRVAGSRYAAGSQSSGESYGTDPGAGVLNESNEGLAAPVYRDDGQQQPIRGDEYDQYASLLDTTVPEVQQPPPPLPEYEQPEAPASDYLWTPGYWNYAPAGYYYVPGAWIAPPFVGALWTPGWWGGNGRGYRWHHGLWGRHVGYYGGINYGYGFIGYGYQGGYWNNDHFYYNRACNRVNERVVNNYTYVRNVTVVNNTYVNNTRVSYAGGHGGIQRPPAPQEAYAVREQHLPPMAVQMQQRQVAAQNRGQFYNASNGRPQLLAVARPLQADRNLNLRAFAPASAREQSASQTQPLRPAGVQPGFAQPGTPQASGPQANRPGLSQSLQSGRLPSNNRLGPAAAPLQSSNLRGGFTPPAGLNRVGPNITTRDSGQPVVSQRGLPQKQGSLPINQVQPQVPWQRGPVNLQRGELPRPQPPTQAIQPQQPIQQRQVQAQQPTQQQRSIQPQQPIQRRQEQQSQPRQTIPLQAQPRSQVEQQRSAPQSQPQRQPAPQTLPQRAPQPQVQQPQRAPQPQVQQQRIPAQPPAPRAEPSRSSEPPHEGGGRPRR